ncbi:hypothetical protein GCM10007301_56990 [Azorhizobium oxalatiphilum]|uniref:Uncharacterized protein n=1 Tax=Azorhizobium oxalatiphilum TaxID=980631 RepID=A0A917CIK4_9HYPH|nr:hypothetical protein [Azorhizobium oxalatiphilum]GGF89692.1 hypothetical protein GCM10007301_56990 [Azorhizobium oxalatiphilum]
MGTSIRSIYLAVDSDCQAEGMHLPPGKYNGVERRLVVIGHQGGAEWLEPAYTVSLTQPRLHQIGGDKWREVREVELDVTPCVTSGQIRLA